MPENSIRIVREELLSDHYFPLKTITYEQRRGDGSWQEQQREVYLSASGAAVLLYNPRRETVLLTRQFRIGAHLAGSDGYLLEAPAGVLDGASPADCIRKEIREECGYAVDRVDKVMTLFASPSSLPEQVHYFIAEYDDADRCGKGGGNKEEGEDIELLELPFHEAVGKIGSEIVDAKTVILLQYMQLRQMRQ